MTEHITKIISWNINSIRARIENLHNLLKSESPDILILQEIKVEDSKFPFNEFEFSSYNIKISGQKSYNGVAIFSKKPIDLIQKDILINERQDARFLLCNTFNLRLACVYVPNGTDVGHENFYYKLDYMQKLSDICSKFKDDNFIIGGDFNITFDDSDVYNPKGWKGKITCTDEERNSLKNFINSNNFIDSSKIVSSNQDVKYTWWDYRFNGYAKNHGIRIDYFFTSSKLKDKITNYKVLTKYRELEKPSDHAPILLCIKE